MPSKHRISFSGKTRTLPAASIGVLLRCGRHGCGSRCRSSGRNDKSGSIRIDMAAGQSHSLHVPQNCAGQNATNIPRKTVVTVRRHTHTRARTHTHTHTHRHTRAQGTFFLSRPRLEYVFAMALRTHAQLCFPCFFTVPILGSTTKQKLGRRLMQHFPSDTAAR
jgi:hypothetical protein